MNRISVLVADDHAVMREGLVKILDACPDIQVVGQASNGLEALRKVYDLKPNVILLDLSMPQLDGLEVARRVKKESPATQIVVLTMHDEEEYALKVIRSGASGYLLKDSAAVDVIEAIRNVAAGKAFFSPQIAGLLAETYRETARVEDDPYERLNDREREILQLIAEGHTNKQIAAMLFLSPKTVDNHRTNLMRKLDLHSTASLVRWAARKGLVK